MKSQKDIIDDVKDRLYSFHTGEEIAVFLEEKLSNPTFHDKVLQSTELKRKWNELLNEKFLEYSHDGYVAPVLVCLRNRITVDIARQNDGYTALALAANNNHVEVVKILLEHGADIDKFMNDYGQTPLILAAQSGSAEVTKVMLNHNRVRANNAAVNNFEALNIALRHNHPEVVKILIEHERGADINRLSAAGTTILQGTAVSNTNAILRHVILSQRNRGDDWRIMWQGDTTHSSQLNNQAVQNKLDKTTVSLLAVVLPDDALRADIIANYNNRNPEQTLDSDDNLQKIAKLRNLKTSLTNAFIAAGNDTNYSAALANIAVGEFVVDKKKLADCKSFVEYRHGIMKTITSNIDLGADLTQQVGRNIFRNQKLDEAQNSIVYEVISEDVSLFRFFDKFKPLPQPAPQETTQVANPVATAENAQQH